MKFPIALVLLCAVAHADTPTQDRSEPVDTHKMSPWRVKIDSYATGEFLGWPKNHCGPDVVDHVRRIVMKYPYIEVIDGKMAARIDEKRPVPAQRQVLGDTFVAFYDVSATRTIVFTIRWRDARDGKDGKDGTVPVEVSVIDSSATGGDPNARFKSCRETWLGYGKRI